MSPHAFPVALLVHLSFVPPTGTKALKALSVNGTDRLDMT